jgi:hypothetical protein
MPTSVDVFVAGNEPKRLCRCLARDRAVECDAAAKRDDRATIFPRLYELTSGLASSAHTAATDAPRTHRVTSESLDP